ncbi:MAG: SUF system Fe-S cluster assembly regulator [Terriglobales bacterium]
MLKLTKKADYGLIAVKHLAECGQGACSAKDMAEAYGIPPEALAKILQRLVKAGLLHSHHGMNGGYALARDARSITAFEVIKSIDGPVLITSCTTKHGDCEQSLRCTVREPLRRVNESIQEVLSRITIAEMKGDTAAHVHGREEKEKPAAELVGITSIAN